MKGVSIVIPLRVETWEREANLHCILHFLLQLECVYVDILEADVKRHFFFSPTNHIRYRFIYDESPVFDCTKYLNILLKDAQHSIVGVWNTDILVPESQLKQAINYIQEGYVMCFPYGGDCRFLNETDSNIIRKIHAFRIRCRVSRKLIVHR